MPSNSKYMVEEDFAIFTENEYVGSSEESYAYKILYIFAVQECFVTTCLLFTYMSDKISMLYKNAS